jgi:hypothetical protein
MILAEARPETFACFPTIAQRQVSVARCPGLVQGFACETLEEGIAALRQVIKCAA